MVYKYREVRGTFTALTPDTTDADEHPNIVPLEGAVVLTPRFSNGGISFAELGHFDQPQVKRATIENGELKAVVVDEESGHLTRQALFLPVTDDDRADQQWSYEATFPEVVRTDTGDRVVIPPRRFVVEGGDGPLNLAAVATAQKAGAIVTRGPRGYAVTEVSATNGELVFAWEDGRADSIPMPEAVPGPPPAVEWDGPHLVVEGERSPDLRGPNALPADEFVEGVVLDPGSLTGEALRDTFITSRATNDGIELGADLIGSTGWAVGAGWVGNFTTGFTHTPGGGTAPLTWTHGGLDTTKTYLLRFTVDSPNANVAFSPEAFTLTIGGQSMFPIYEGGPTVTTYQRAFTPTSQSPLVLTPNASALNMTLSGVSLQEVVASTAPTSVWRGSDGQVGSELRTTGDSSQFLGREAGRFHTGRLSVGVGFQALMDDVSGFFNVVVGARALQHAQRTSRNVAVGFRSLENNIMADRNVAVGPFSGHTLTTGNENTLVGVDTMWQTENSSRNVAVGLYALDRADNIESCIGIGMHSLKRANGGVENIGVGSYALKEVRGNRNIAIGEFASEETTTATSTVAVGSRALRNNLTGTGQIALGYETAQHSNGNYNVAIGQRALEGVAGQTTGTHNVAIGLNSGRGITTGSNNIMIGRAAGSIITTGSYNILIGDDANQPITGDYILNIGGVIKGDLRRLNFGVAMDVPTARMHLPASDGSPRSAPLKLTGGGELLEVPETGALEYAGGRLYFTTGNGRFEIAFVEEGGE